VILTGKHSHINGFRQNGDSFDGSQPTFPKYLQAAGYQTALLGKWHLGSRPQGFDYWRILPGQGDYYNPELVSAEGTQRITGHCTDVVTDLAIDWLQNRRDAERPFLLMCQHKAPHRNWMPALRHLPLYNDHDIPVPDSLFDHWQDNASAAREQHMTIRRHMHPWYDLFFGPKTAINEETTDALDLSGVSNLDDMTPGQRRQWDEAFQEENNRFIAKSPRKKERVRWKLQRYLKNYLRCIRGVDESVGRLVQYLAESGLEKDTVVIYSSDQGFFLGEHGWYDKRWMYEESLRMPLIVRWPGVINSGSECDALVQNLDFAQTFLEITGTGAPDDMQGRSLVPLLTGESPVDWRRSVYYHYYEHPGIHNVARHHGVRTDSHKLIHFYMTDEWEYYDLRSDPNELHNQYTAMSNTKTVKKLKDELHRLKKMYRDNSR
jgi:arylsulfatase A-like enzyme